MMTNQNTAKAGSVLTTWALRTYDVWGNARDGWDVNDVYDGGEIELRIPQTRHNIGVEWHVCRNPKCPGNNPCGHNPPCTFGAHRRESHGVIGRPVYEYDTVAMGMSLTPSRHDCPECGAPVTVESPEFTAAAPSDRQIKRAFGVKCRITTDGDDLHIDVTRARDGYPIGALECMSHESLSPVRPNARHEVIVGNIGTVYDGPSEIKALAKYDTYVNQSRDNYGRAAGESVTMLTNGEISREYSSTED